MIHISSSLEDYLEGILIIERTQPVARVKDVAALLKVKSPSVNESLQKLSRKGLVRHQRYGSVELTPQGRELAKKVYRRHTTLKKFFNDVLGVAEARAEEDACKAEHHLSAQTIERMVQLITFIERCPQKRPDWLRNFYSFARTKKMPAARCKRKTARKK